MNIFCEQLLALLTFFAFPIIQYGIVKWSSSHDGNPELWYLPSYGFRLVIRNLPRKKKLFDIKYRSFTRKIIPSNVGSSVKSYIDTELINREDFFLYPGIDQILISFKLISEPNNKVIFIHTDKLGNELSRKSLTEFDKLISDYTASIKNLFQFDAKIEKRIEIEKDELISFYEKITKNNQEQSFPLTVIK